MYGSDERGGCERIDVWAIPRGSEGEWLVMVGWHLGGRYREAPLPGWVTEAQALQTLRRLRATFSPDRRHIDLRLLPELLPL